MKDAGSSANAVLRGLASAAVKDAGSVWVAGSESGSKIASGSIAESATAAAAAAGGGGVHVGAVPLPVPAVSGASLPGGGGCSDGGGQRIASTGECLLR